MTRIEVKNTGEFDTVDAAGDVFTLVESSTIYIDASENAPLQARVAHKSYKLKNGLYVNQTDVDRFEIVRTGMKLQKVSTSLNR